MGKHTSTRKIALLWRNDLREHRGDSVEGWQAGGLQASRDGGPSAWLATENEARAVEQRHLTHPQHQFAVVYLAGSQVGCVSAW